MAKAKSNNALAAKARARMARRAKRARYWKENKKRIMMIVLAFFLLLFLAFFTPFGPDYYRSKIELEKMDSPSVVKEGAIHDLYKLGVFYQYTMRSNPQALEVYDEIARLYYGFKFADYSRKPTEAFEKRRQAKVRIKRNQIVGPPFEVAESDIRYVALAIWRYGEIIQYDRSKQFAYNIYKDLYLDEMAVEHPELLEREVTEYIKIYCDRFVGAR